MFEDAEKYAEKIEVLVAEKQIQQQHNFMISKNLSKFEVKPMNHHNIPSTGIIEDKQAMGMYTEFEDDCQKDSFPITAMKDLLETKSRIPSSHIESQETIENISHSIHCRLHVIIQETNTDVLDMISPYTEDRNRYRTLWTTIQRTYSFMRPTPEG